MRRRRRGRLGRGVFRLLALTLAAFIGGFVWFDIDLETMPTDPPGDADAIVVLTGGSQRLERGLALLAEGKGRKLFVSGVAPGVDTASLLHAAHAEGSAEECCIVLGHGADDTAGNARETADWLAREHYGSLRLVTANYHMRRALLEFRRILPAEVAILPVPVRPDPQPSTFWPWRGWSHVVTTEYLKYLGALARAAIFAPDTTPGDGP